jgi:predicted glycosyltransferase
MMTSLPKRLSFVSYAVNGRGLGHLSRQIAIQRWIRRYARFAGVHSEHWFLTTSEADTLLHREGFAGFKLPSKSVVETAGISKPAYLALAKQWVWNSIALVRPDVLLVDTFPNGSFQELLGVLDLCRHKALVLRPVKEEFASRPAFKAVAALYDRIVIPQTADAAERQSLGLPPERVRHVGPVMRAERFEAFDRAQARHRLGVPPDARCWLVSGGGGGDDTVAALYDRIDELSASDPSAWWVFAAGPLFRGRPRTGPQRVWWTTPDLATHLAAFDGAISAAGYNSVHELLFSGVPTIFVPQPKVADDQSGRVDRYVAQGAALRASLQPESLRLAMRRLADPATATAMAAAARQAVPANHARDAAREILGLCLPASLLEHAHEELDDALLTEAAAAEVDVGDIVDLAATLAHDAADDPNPREHLDLSPALELLIAARTADVPDAALVRIAQVLARKLKGPRSASTRQLADALEALVAHPAVAGQWSAVTMLLGSIPSERSWDAGQLVDAWCALADDALDHGHDVLALTRMLLEDHDGDDDDPSDVGKNAAVIARLRARLPGAEPTRSTEAS